MKIITALMFFCVAALSGCSSDEKAESENTSNSSSLEVHDIIVDENGYSPEKIKITDAKTKKVQLNFQRMTDATCATEVIYEPQDINVKLPIGEKISVVFDITKDNEITFGCHMDKMLKGVIVKQVSL